MTPSARTTTDAPLEEQGLSAYERLRLAKIARNEAHLESLGLKKKQPILKSISGNQQNNSSNSKKRKRHEKVVTSKERPQRRRRSSPRLKENKPNKDGSKSVDSELENAKDWMKRHSFGDDVANGKKRNQTASKRNSKPIVKKKTPAASAMDDLRDYERDAFFALREWKRARGERARIQQSLCDLSQPHAGGDVSDGSGRRRIFVGCLGHQPAAIGTTRGIDAGSARTLAQTIAGGARQIQPNPREWRILQSC